MSELKKQIEDDARRYANKTQFMSNYPHDWNSAYDGYIQGAMDVLRPRKATEADKSTGPALHKQSVMPSLHLFKERRDKLNLTLRQVAEQTNVSAATISRIEREDGQCSYHNVVMLDDFYCRNGA